MSHKHIRKMKFFLRLRDLYLVHMKWRKYQIGYCFHAGRGVSLWAKNKIIIGTHCSLGSGTKINCDVVMGNYVFTANNVAFVGKHDHNFTEIGKPILYSTRVKDDSYIWSPAKNLITIEDDVWIGFGAIILSGVKIGEGSVIAAGSVVVKDVEPFTIYAGVPAKKVKNRFNAIDLIEHKKLYNERY